jgi:hypothetical protein
MKLNLSVAGTRQQKHDYPVSASRWIIGVVMLYFQPSTMNGSWVRLPQEANAKWQRHHNYHVSDLDAKPLCLPIGRGQHLNSVSAVCTSGPPKWRW